MERWSVFVACAPGLEHLLGEEIAALGADAAGMSVVAGGVELLAGEATLYRLHLELGLALKILVRLGEFRAKGFRELERAAASLAWEHWCRPGRAVHVRATCRHSRLWHSDAVAQRFDAAIAERLARASSQRGRRKAPSSETEAAEVHVRIVDDLCTVSIDTGGDVLSRRGYREAGAKAPLREDLARALVIASGWDRQSLLVDPLAGSATIAIEADWLARGVPPGHMRSFALFDMPGFDAGLWNELKASALGRSVATGPAIFASDRDAGAVKAARANAERAGSAGIQIDEAALMKAPGLALPAPEHGAVVSNPPWGRRVRGRDPLANLYAAFGNKVRALPGRWRVALVVPSPELSRATGLALEPALMTDHGGVKVYFAVGEGRAAMARRRAVPRRRKRDTVPRGK
ncbi:MAG TPA: hypothetical protein VEL28_18385 [Candidatus Binatia bacterium]|nr:hypothetical protein [Candidatus Binatia bacterium]